MPPASSSTPGMSSLGRAGDGWRPSSSAPPTKATPAKIRFTYSVHRQDRYSVSEPPSSRPTAPQAPGDRAVDSRRRVAFLRVGEGGGQQRQRRRHQQRRERALAGPRGDQHGEVDRGAADGRHRREKPASPVRNVTFRPNWSDSLPPSSTELPNDSVYAVTTHCRSTVENPSARCADGNAIFKHRQVQHHHQLRQAHHPQQHPAPPDQAATGDRGFSHDNHTPFPC